MRQRCLAQSAFPSAHGRPGDTFGMLIRRYQYALALFGAYFLLTLVQAV